MSSYPQIVVGTYEEFLLGYEIIKQPDGDLKLNLNMASHAHQASIRCVASNRHLLASSGADEFVNVFTMVSRKEVAVLTPHAGTVTALEFAPDGTHLISGSQDGSIAIFRCSDWTLMKVWKDAHKKANGVLGLSVHPTGKLLLSIGADHIMRVWNLIKGRQAYAVNFSKRIGPGITLNLVRWSRDGSFYAIALGQIVEIYNVETAAVVYTINSSSRISCFDFCQSNLIALGRDDGSIEIHNFIKKEQILEENCHENRIKCLQCFETEDRQIYFVSADSLGVVRLWRWKKQRQAQKLIKESDINADCRIVCMTLINSDNFVKKEEKAAENGVTEKPKSTDDSDVNEVVEVKKNNESNAKRIKSASSKSDKKRRSSLNSSKIGKHSANKRLSFSTSNWNVT